MFHANTRKIIDDWTARRGDRHAPARTDISPAALKDVLPQVFILGGEADGRDAFRLVGGLLGDLHRRDLRGVDFFSLFHGSDRERAREALADARREGAPVVLAASAWSADGDEARIEVVLAPLVGPTGELDRVLGLYQPTTTLRRLMGRPVELLTLREANLADGDAPFLAFTRPPPRSHLRLVAVDGARVG